MNQLLLESIKVRDGIPENLFWHQQRVNSSIGREKLHLASALQEIIMGKAPVEKARILYTRDGHIVERSITPYLPLFPQSLGLIECQEIDYHFKYADRHPLLEAKKRRSDTEEIIITRNGYLTDTTYSNIAFWDHHHWITPAHYLLAGTKRSALLAAGAIKEKAIMAHDLKSFSHCSLINAMLDLGEVIIPIENIRI